MQIRQPCAGRPRGRLRFGAAVALAVSALTGAAAEAAPAAGTS
jgi:hypothetical protein